MTSETIRSPGGLGLEEDPDSGTGLRLVAEQRKNRLIQTMKIGAVWILLVALLIFVLLQLNIDPGYAIGHLDFILQGLLYTVWVSLVSILIASVLALLGALGRLSKNSIAQGISGLYVSLIRGTPLLIQIYLIYLGLPQIGTQLEAYGFHTLGRMFTLTAIQSGILALSLNYGAYMTEIFRAGIQSIAHGQREAAASIGMTNWQMYRRVILPQAVRVIIPDIGNQFIAMQKDSALVSIIGIWEITFRANRLGRQEGKFVEMLLMAALVYWLLTIVSSWLESRLERRLTEAYER
ncbi:MAG: amino acid ABC transporter permease [Omnitrophica WOR_2 bacterium]